MTRSLYQSITGELEASRSPDGTLTEDAYMALFSACCSETPGPGYRLDVSALAARLNVDASVVKKIVAYHEGDFDPKCIASPPLTNEAKFVFSQIQACEENPVKQIFCW